MDDPPLSTRPDELPVLKTPTAYVCPGEDHPIPRSIHLARLAAYYPKCRQCEHRHDTGQLPRSTVGRLEQTAARVVRPSPFGDEGVRGPYLNHITRQIAGRVAAALADHCWESQPLTGQVPSFDDEAGTPEPHSSPVIVLGHDARPASPDLCVGVSAALRRMGCEVVDVGRVSGPCHAYSVEHLQADAGLFVTGGGCPAQWTGLDLVGPRGVCWSKGSTHRPGTLPDIERRFLAGVSRPTRMGGAQRYFDAGVPYRASLPRHFRDLVPMRVVIAAADPVLLPTLQEVCETLPVDLMAIDAPPRTGEPAAGDPMTRAFREAIRQTDAACGVAIAEDGQGLVLFDEQGRLIDLPGALVWLINEQRGSRRLTVCVRDEQGDLFPAIEGAVRSAECIVSGREALAGRLFDPVAGFGIEPGGRLWMKDAVPVCDAILTLGLLLRTLSRHREPLSTLLGSTRMNADK